MRIRVLAIWGLAVVVVMFVAAVAAVKLLISPDAIAKLMVPRIQSAIGRDVRIGSSELTIFGGIGAHIRDVEISNNPPFSSRPLARIESVDAKLQLLPLLWGDLKLKQLAAHGCEVYLIKDSSGVNNYDFLDFRRKGSKRDAGDARESLCDVLSIDKSRLLFRNDSTGTRMVCGGVDIQVDLGSGEQTEPEGSLRMDSLFRWSRLGDFLIYPDAVEYKFTGEYHTNSDSLIIEDCQWRVDKISGHLNGIFRNATAMPDYDLHILSEHSDLAGCANSQILSAFPILRGAKLDGELRIDVTCRGSLGGQNTTSVRGRVNITDAVMRLPQSENDLRAKLIESDFNEQSLSVFTEGATINSTPALLRLAIDSYTDPTISGEIKVACDAGFIGEIRKWDRQKRLTGKVDLSLSGFVKPSDNGQARLFGALILEGISYSDPALNWSLDTLNLMCNFAGNDAELTQLDLAVGENRLRMSGKIVDFAPYLAALRHPSRRPQFNFVCTADTFNFDTLSTRVERQADGKDTSLVLEVLDYLFDFDARGRLQIWHGAFAGVVFDELKTDVAVVNRIISSDSSLCLMFGGACANDVLIDANDLLAPEFEIDCSASGLQASDFLSRFTGFQGHLDGRLDLEATFKGKGLTAGQIAPSLTASGKATIRKGRITNFGMADFFRNRFGIEAFSESELSDLQATFRIADEAIQLNPIAFESGRATYQVDGSISLDGAYDCRVSRTLTKDEARTLTSLPEATGLSRGRGATKAVFRITGDADTTQMGIEAIQSRD